MKKLILILPVLLFTLSGCQTATPKFYSPITKFYSSFDTAPSYEVPHKYNTTSKAASFEKGVLRVTLDPGMHGTAGDSQNHTERAELAQELPFGSNVRMSFRFRVGKNFRVTARTMISQIHFEPFFIGSPLVSVYADSGGRAKCVSYRKTGQFQEAKTFAPINLTDGNWHEIVMILIPSHSDGYCSVDIDGINKIKRFGLNNIPSGTPNLIRARIGLYRDAQPFSQIVYFDDWKVETFQTEPN